MKLSWGPRKHSMAEKLKSDSVQTQGDSSTSNKSADCSGATAANGCRATGDMNISDHTISLWRQGIWMLLLCTILLWWRPAISHHSVLLIFRRSRLLRFSDHQISALCQAWTKSKSSWWNSKENNELTSQKIFWGNSERENQAGYWIQNLTACVECSSWSFKKTEQNGLPGSNSVRHSIKFGQWTGCSSRWRFDWRGWGTRRWLCVLYWSFLWRSQCRRVDTMCKIFQMGAQTLCWYGGRFCLRNLSGINTVMFLVCSLFNCNF
jgi:hypothetical protein